MLYRDSYIKINIDNFKHNLDYLKKISNKKLIAVVKANAYGCGDYEIAKILEEFGINFLAVSSLDEALSLRHQGIKSKILILSYVNPEFLDVLIENNLTMTLSSIDLAQELAKKNLKDLKIQIKVDTGMNRIGLRSLEEVQDALKLLSNNVEGIFTHYALSDDQNSNMTYKQYKKFESIIKKVNYSFKYIHTCNTDATINFDDKISNHVRCGLGMFGLSSYDTPLKPVVSLYSKVINCKLVEKGSSIGYGATYQTKEAEWIITIPIGYADGWIRSNQGRRAYINNESSATFVGRICMDQSMLKVDHQLKIGTEVELFGSHISINEVASELNTISYEILTILSDRLTKVYYYNDHQIRSFTPRFEKSF